MRLCSARACKMLWRIHHTAYEMNLKPRVSSNFSAALMSPTFPSLMRSARSSPWFWYCFATETTKRRLAFVSRSRASRSPLRMRCASSTSSLAESSSSWPISCRYFSSDALSLLVIDFVIFSCLIRVVSKKYECKNTAFLRNGQRKVEIFAYFHFPVPG